MENYVTEIPSYLKQLARLVARGFFQIEDSLLIDMLVRNTCMKEKEIEELLKFDSKLLRARLNTLRNEKFLQTKLRMETGLDGKAQKVNYYFINYKSLVNVIKYKLDHMRKRMETQERDATNRASFKCNNCLKTFTDLEAGELFDPMTETFYCTFCRSEVQEDESAVPKKDSRLMLAKFNDQMHMLFELLRKAEDIKLAPELLDPEPARSFGDTNDNSSNGRERGMWSGEATRSTGTDSTRIDITIGDDAANKPREQRKERPVWMMESTIGDPAATAKASGSKAAAVETTSEKAGPREDTMSILMEFEKKGGTLDKSLILNESESDEDDPDEMKIPDYGKPGLSALEVDDSDVGVMEDDEEDDSVPMVTVGSERVPINQVDESVIAKMTPAEKETYVQQFQDYCNYD